MKICAKEARRLKSKIEFRRLLEKMKRRFWTYWRSTKSTDIWRSDGGFGIQVENLLYYCFSAQPSTLGVFFCQIILFRPRIHQPFREYFNLIFPTKRIFEPTVLLLKKAARCHHFLAVVRCLFHNQLRLKRSSLLNVLPKL